MSTSTISADERVASVEFQGELLVVGLKDGRRISVPVAWYPRLANATAEQRNHWQVVGGGFGIHWPALDEDLSTAGLLRGTPAPS